MFTSLQNTFPFVTQDGRTLLLFILYELVWIRILPLSRQHDMQQLWLVVHCARVIHIVSAFTFTLLDFCFISDKTVFGVPLTVTLQRTGHSLPKPIQSALNWLKNNALDQVIFDTSHNDYNKVYILGRLN